jgi:branched-chain amino acid transport system substrate-binding protein
MTPTVRDMTFTPWPWRPFRLALGVMLPVLLLGCASSPSEPSEPRRDAQEPAAGHASPYFDARTQEAEYYGPGREDLLPEGPTEVRIGWFGPEDCSHPAGGGMWLAAILATEQANREGGCHGLPFRLLPRWSENPWGTGVRQVTRLVYENNVWAIAGAPDGPSAHLVEQVTAKARLPFLSCASTDRSANLANVPWIFSLVPADDAIARVLAPAIIEEAAGGSIAVVSATDHDSRMTVKELTAELNRLDAFPSHHVNLRPGDRDFNAQLTIIRQAHPAVVVVIAGAADSASFLRALREAGVTACVFGGPGMARQQFVALAGQAAEGVRVPLLWSMATDQPAVEEFVAAFSRRAGVPPDYAAAYTYDAMNLLFAAIRQADLNRARIRDAIRSLSGFDGVTGPINWDPTGQNVAPVRLGVIRDGAIVPHRPAANHTHSRTN